MPDSNPVLATAEALNRDLGSGLDALRRIGLKRVRNLGILLGFAAVFSIWAIASDGWNLFFQRFVDAIGNGFLYSAMALALVLIYKATTVVNFAQGEMAMFGTFIAYIISHDWGWSARIAIPLAMVISAVGAAGIERLLIRPFDPANHLAITIVTLSLFVILGAVASIIWGADPRAFDTPFPMRNERFDFLGAEIEYTKVFSWITVLVAVALVTLLLKRTKVGLAFRAVSSNLESSRLAGVHIGRTLQFGWALAAAVGTLAGCLYAPTVYLSPTFMGGLLVYSFAAATLGGLDSLGGAVVAGLVIGLVQTMAGGYIDQVGSELATASALLVIVVILVVRPNGLFGSKRVERV